MPQSDDLLSRPSYTQQLLNPNNEPINHSALVAKINKVIGTLIFTRISYLFYQVRTQQLTPEEIPENLTIPFIAAAVLNFSNLGLGIAGYATSRFNIEKIFSALKSAFSTAGLALTIYANVYLQTTDKEELEMNRVFALMITNFCLKIVNHAIELQWALHRLDSDIEQSHTAIEGQRKIKAEAKYLTNKYFKKINRHLEDLTLACFQPIFIGLIRATKNDTLILFGFAYAFLQLMRAASDLFTESKKVMHVSLHKCGIFNENKQISSQTPDKRNVTDITHTEHNPYQMP